jgi:ABC-type nickel/cobalt efflux system permease component RcnA
VIGRTLSPTSFREPLVVVVKMLVVKFVSTTLNPKLLTLAIGWFAVSFTHRDRQTDTDTDTDTHRHTHTHTHARTHTHTHTHTHALSFPLPRKSLFVTDMRAHTHTNKHTNTHTETDRQTNKKTGTESGANAATMPGKNSKKSMS